MELVHTQTDGDITYCLFIDEEHIPVKGNAIVSGDDKEDAKVERSILRQLRNGNLWAWCTVKVEARHNDHPGVEGHDYLGACSYKSTKDFIQPGGYWDDMKSEAKDMLLTLLQGKS
jgi:hypothetical protein